MLVLGLIVSRRHRHPFAKSLDFPFLVHRASPLPPVMPKQVVDDPGNEGTSTADIEQEEATAEAPAEAGAETLPLPAAAMTTPVLLPVPVPTARSLRMFLSVLKHNPAGVVREVGVLLMLHVASTEVAIAAESPPALVSKGGSTAGGRTRRGLHPQTKQRRDSAHLKRRSQEAAAVLALALSAEKRRNGRLGAGTATAARLIKSTKTRFRHQLRQPAKVEDRLQAWAATRGREVTALKELLTISAAGNMDASSAGAQLVRDRAGRIAVGEVGKVRQSVCACIRSRNQTRVFRPSTFFPLRKYIYCICGSAGKLLL